MFPMDPLLDENMQFWTSLNYSCVLGSWPKEGIFKNMKMLCFDSF